MRWLGLIMLFAGLISSGARAQDLRSDSPLWTYQVEHDTGLYPEAFTDRDSFGCSIPLRLGIYRRIAADAETDETDEIFVRIENYGVFHCALIFGISYDLENAKAAFEDHAWFIVLGKMRRPDGDEDELVALQIGVRTGSRYELFLRQASQPSAPLRELDWQCPAKAEHRVAHLDIWVQNSCVVSSKAEILRIARSAARRPILATLEMIPGVDTVSSEPNSD